jgi:hypothetical protein
MLRKMAICGCNKQHELRAQVVLRTCILGGSTDHGNGCECGDTHGSEPKREHHVMPDRAKCASYDEAPRIPAIVLIAALRRQGPFTHPQNVQSTQNPATVVSYRRQWKPPVDRPVFRRSSRYRDRRRETLANPEAPDQSESRQLFDHIP